MWSKHEVWQKMLGHASDAAINKIQQIRNIGQSGNQFCDSCIRAKHSRLPFPISFAKTTSCFDLIHAGIWGREHHPSLSCMHFCSSIVDNYSHGV